MIKHCYHGLVQCTMYILHCVRKKRRLTCFFCNIFYKLGRVWSNLMHNFLNKFAAKSYKRFPSHLNFIIMSTLPCETWNAHRARATTALSEKVTPKFITDQLWASNSLDLNPVDYSVWQYCEKRCIKHASLIWSYQRRNWRMAAAMTT